MPESVPERSTSGRFVLPLGSSVPAFWGSAKNDIWAPLQSFEKGPTTLLHFDGTTWTPAAGPVAMDPQSISGTASNDVWIAGVDADNATVVIRFDGTAWTSMAVLPSTEDSVNTLIYAASPTAVTVFRGASINQWNGSTWAQTLLPNDSGLRTTDIAGVDREHVYFRQTNGSGRILKWDGAVATPVVVPSDQMDRLNSHNGPRGFHSDISSLAVATDKTLWLGSNGSEVRTWDTQHAALGPVLITGSPGPFEIFGVSGTANDVWIVGIRRDTPPLGGAFALHFDGATWTQASKNNLPGLARAVWVDGPDSAWVAADVLVHVP